MFHYTSESLREPVLDFSEDFSASQNEIPNRILPGFCSVARVGDRFFGNTFRGEVETDVGFLVGFSTDFESIPRPGDRFFGNTFRRL